MNPQPLSSLLEFRLREAMAAVLPPEVADADPQVRRSDHADFQADGILPLARPLRANPRELASRVVAELGTDEVIAAAEVSGPGFINLTVNDDAILRQVGARRGDARLGLARTRLGETTVIDYSQPNIAKEMHVGHLRGTIIGDVFARVLAFLGGDVVRQNHLGDWGTQFGMLIQYVREHPEITWRADDLSADMGGQDSLSNLNVLYRVAREEFDRDPEFADRARQRVVALQSHDAETLAVWQAIVDESKRYFNEVYDVLGVLLTDDDAVGESFYNPFLSEVAQELEDQGVAVVSDGALCVFFDDITGPDGSQVPLIVRKRDGGFGYAATDLAAIRYRVNTLKARRLLYVVDARQALHFRMVFETARRAGWLTDDVTATHVAFGTVLGPDGKPFKTRSGQTVRLISLLDEAVDRARQTVHDKSPHLDPETLDRIAREVGIGAVKYADLATSRTRDYMFNLDRMVSLNGNTGVYLQYAHARVRSILRRLPDGLDLDAMVPAVGVGLEPAERALALLLDGFEAAVNAVAETLEPHVLCGYLYNLAQAFTDFYETCPVLKAAREDVRDNRVLLCQLTGDTLRLGLDLLGVAAPDRL